uniref:Uncharacterized protein n=1 Tax=Sinocyclocheilus grahami TaxID=75366 RepID=A0A672T114_SINGR
YLIHKHNIFVLNIYMHVFVFIYIYRYIYRYIYIINIHSTHLYIIWYGVQDDGSVGEPSESLPPSSSLSHLDMPPPYEAVSGANDLKPPPYSEYAQNNDTDASLSIAIPDSNDSSGISDAPPPYTASITFPANQQVDGHSQSQPEGSSS